MVTSRLFLTGIAASGRHGANPGEKDRAQDFVVDLDVEVAERGLVVLAGSLRGAGDTHFIMVATTIGMWAVRVPLALITGVWLHLGIFYVWLAMIADWTLRMGLMLWRYRSERWKAIQVIR